MNKCLEPCKQACTAEQYATRTAAVKAFFTRAGEACWWRIGAERGAASAEMEFEKAAALHTQGKR